VRRRMLLGQNLNRGAVLYDGRTCALWKVQRQGRKSATLNVEPIVPLSSEARSSVEAEGHRLLAFVATPAALTDVRVQA
jgi:hypothetical protein